MRFGMHLPQWGAWADRAGVLEVARTAEAAGFDSVWVGDHLAWPREWASPYPYAPAPPAGPEEGFLESFTTLAVVAGGTERIGLGTGALVLPLRHPLVVAKTAATLDVLSGGRVTLALGTGWLREEFEALDQPFPGRGRRLERSVALLREAWANGTVAGDAGPGARETAAGEYDFPEVFVLPKPVQAGGPRLWLAGLSEATLRRAARVADGWYASGAADAETFERARRTLDEGLRDAGRDPGAFTVATVTRFGTDLAELRARVGQLASSGVQHVTFGVLGDDLAALCRAVETFGTELLPEFGERPAT